MKKFYIIGFLVLLTFDTLAQVCFKYASHHTPFAMDTSWLISIISNPWVYCAFIGYIGAFFTWMTLLKRAPVGPAFAASHLDLVSVTVVSIWLFHEPLTLYKAIGGLLIIGGVLCLAKGQKPEENI